MSLKLKKIGASILILIIICLSAASRFIGLDRSPSSINFDEAALGYNAFSLLETGRDEYGRKFPLSIRSFNDYKPALYSYLSIIPIKFLGLNEVSTRFISAFAGVIQIVILYFIYKSFFRRKFGFIALGLLIASLQPWRIHYSRVASESNLSVLFFITGTGLLITAKKTPQAKRLIIASLAFLLSAYSYHSARFAAAIFLLLWAIDPLKIIINSSKTNAKEATKRLIPLIIFLLGLLPLILSPDNKLTLTRFRQTNLFQRLYPYTPKELIASQNPWLNFPPNPIYHLSGTIVGHFASYFSPINLGSRLYHWVRYSPQHIPTFGLLGWVESFLFIFGIFVLFKKIRTSFQHRNLIYWILAGTTPAVVTLDWFHPLRSLNILPALEIISLMGLFFIIKQTSQLLNRLSISPKVAINFLIIALFTFIIPIGTYRINNELVFSPWENHGEFQPGGYKEGVPILASIQDDYEQVIIDTPHAQSYIFFLFYQQFPPEKIQKYAQIRPRPGIEGDLTFDFYKYKFRYVDWPKDKNLHNTIFWGTSLLKRDEILAEDNTDIIQINNVVGNTAALIITKK